MEADLRSVLPSWGTVIVGIDSQFCSLSYTLNSVGGARGADGFPHKGGGYLGLTTARPFLLAS